MRGTRSELYAAVRARRKAAAAPAAVAAALLAAAPGVAAAQREQAGLRVETIGGGSIGDAEACLPGRGCLAAGGTGTLRVAGVALNAGTRRFVGRDGNTALYHGVQLRALRAQVPGLGIPGGLPPSAGVVGTAFTPASTEGLFVAVYDFMLLHSLSDKTSLVAALRPGLYSDGQQVTLRDFRPEGAVFVDRVVSAKTTLGFGAAYSSNFGRVLPIPVLHVVHVASDKVLVDALLPQRADVWYYPRKGLELGVNASLVGAQYDVAGAPLGASTFQFANATVGPVVRYQVGARRYLSLEAGTTVLRRATFATAGGRTLLALDPANRPFVRAGVQLMY